MAAGLSHPFSLAYALGATAIFHALRREEQHVGKHAEAAIALSTDQGFPFYIAVGRMAQARALTEQGQGQEGIVQMQHGLTIFRAAGAVTGLPAFLATLAEAYGKVERPQEGLTVLAEALAIVAKTGERFHEAELYRLKGELVLQSGVRGLASPEEGQKSKVKGQKSKVPNPQSQILDPSPQGEAEACFHKAIEIARKQQAKSLELRAVMSLSRLWQQQGKRHAARQRLAEIYNWFTEGFDTRDLKEAAVLLEELSA